MNFTVHEPFPFAEEVVDFDANSNLVFSSDSSVEEKSLKLSLTCLTTLFQNFNMPIVNMPNFFIIEWLAIQFFFDISTHLIQNSIIFF